MRYLIAVLFALSLIGCDDTKEFSKRVEKSVSNKLESNLNNTIEVGTAICHLDGGTLKKTGESTYEGIMSCTTTETNVAIRSGLTVHRNGDEFTWETHR